MVTKVFSEVYYDYCDPLLEKLQNNINMIYSFDLMCLGNDLRTVGESQVGFAVFKDTLIKTTNHL
jgi:hypothetical protein